MTAKKTAKTAEPAPEQSTAPEGWRPNPGDTLTGEVVGIEKVESEYGYYPMITLRTAVGDVNIHAFHQVLLKRLTALKPSPGDRLTVTYNGKVVKEGKNPYHSYTASNPDKPTEAFTWDADADGDADF